MCLPSPDKLCLLPEPSASCGLSSFTRPDKGVASAAAMLGLRCPGVEAGVMLMLSAEMGSHTEAAPSAEPGDATAADDSADAGPSSSV